MGKKGSSKRDKDRRTQTTGTLAREQRALRNKSKQHEKRRGKRNNDEDEALFRAQLKADGLRVEVVEGDGNCVFRSLSDQLHGDDSAHVELRAAIVQFEKEQHEHFSHFVEDDESWDDYIERMAQDGEWGGNMEIVAASLLHKAHVVVHQLSAPRFEIRSFGATRTVHLSYHGESHYNSIRAIDDPGFGRVPEGLPKLATDESDKPTPEDRLSQMAPWAPVAAVRAALTATTDRDSALELLRHHRTMGSLNTYGVSSSDSESNSRRRNTPRNKGGTQKQQAASVGDSSDLCFVASRSKQLTRAGHCTCGSGRPYKRCCRRLKKGRDSISARPAHFTSKNHAYEEAHLPATMATLGALRI